MHPSCVPVADCAAHVPPCALRATRGAEHGQCLLKQLWPSSCAGATTTPGTAAAGLHPPTGAAAWVPGALLAHRDSPNDCTRWVPRSIACHRVGRGSRQAAEDGNRSPNRKAPVRLRGAVLQREDA